MANLLTHTTPPLCLPGFEHVNRFWDHRSQRFIAKILPGEFYVSRQPEMIATTLGSCISACVWDDQAKIGGMNHFMLPITSVDKQPVSWVNAHSKAARYGNYAMELMINEILKHGGARENLRSKVIGGGNMFSGESNDVGSKNSTFVLSYLNNENIPIVSNDLGGDYPKKVLFEPMTGYALKKKIKTIHNDTISQREHDYRVGLDDEPVAGGIEIFAR